MKVATTRAVTIAMLATLLAGCAPHSNPGIRADTQFLPASGTHPRYRVARVADTDRETEDIDVAPDGLTAMHEAAGSGQTFKGKARKAAKLSVVNAPFEEFASVAALRSSLPAHETMRNHDPKISTSATSDRIDVERRNVRVSGWIYAAKKEGDNDYHVIIGTAPGHSATFMTVEVSGLPSSGPHRQALSDARQQYRNLMTAAELGLPGTGYDLYEPPIPIIVAGSLFWDANHSTDECEVGPPDLKPCMAWEIHPVTEIQSRAE
jgi:hypothetical protein